MIDDNDKQSFARSHLPYRAEYCATSRAVCKKCDRCMVEGSLKLAYLRRSRFHDGYDSVFYHMKCFFQVKRPTSIAEIRNFETLKYEDQKILEKAIETRGLSLDVDERPRDDENSKRSNKKPIKRDINQTNTITTNFNDFMIEYAKSGRSKCNLCERAIESRTVRIGKLDFDAETPWNGGPVARWFHQECFAKSLEQLEYYGDIDNIPGFDKLDLEDQALVKKNVKTIKPLSILKKETNTCVKKIKSEPDQNGNRADENEEERLLRSQSDRFFELRDLVSQMKRKDLEYLMKHMNQKIDYKATSQLVDAASDTLLFGPIEPCPECKQLASIVLRGASYICTSAKSEWESCSFETREPKRRKPDIPEDLHDKYDFFEDYKFNGGKRIFPFKLIDAIKQRDNDENNVSTKIKPLDGITIGIIAWKGLGVDKSKMMKKINSLGGKLQTVLDKTLFVIMTSENQIQSDNVKLPVARELNIPLVSADSLFKIETVDDVVPKLSESLLEPWDGDLQAKFTQMNVKNLKTNIKSRSSASITKSIYKSSRAPKSQTLVIKDGTAVDPDSGYTDIGRVYIKESHAYSVVLNAVDVEKDRNSFYKLQIIELEAKKRYYLFRSWGRIGCEVGGNSCEKMKNCEAAIKLFEKLFKDRTGNQFEDLVAGTFKRLPGLYFPLELDYGSVKKDIDIKIEKSSGSDLPLPVQDLIASIFDIGRMNRIMQQFELDSEKMPLGKLSKKNINAAMDTLKQLEDVLKGVSRKPNRRALVSLTNKFFSYIPQSFGDGHVELIETLKQVEEKNDMLNSLSEIEIAYNMCTIIDDQSNTSPVDQYYLQLNCSISVVHEDAKEFEWIRDYMLKTHAVTHSNFALEIQHIFRVSREEDMKRFKGYKSEERSLLWHGSRTTNYAGILSRGLKIAPPEAPVTGYMFGKGIYFADMCSKAANYCLTDPSNNVGLLLLCEVALGNTHELFESDPDLPKGLPENMNSVKGVGKSCTNPKTHLRVEDDLLVPIGVQMAAKKVKSQLLYNEYIIYDESRAMIRYVIQAKFNYKS